MARKTSKSQSNSRKKYFTLSPANHPVKMTGLEIGLIVTICVIISAIVIFVIVWAISAKKQAPPKLQLQKMNSVYGIRDPNIFIVLTADGILQYGNPDLSLLKSQQQDDVLLFMVDYGNAKSHFGSRYTSMKVKALKFFSERFALNPTSEGIDFQDYKTKSEIEHSVRIYPKYDGDLSASISEAGFRILITQDIPVNGSFGGSSGKTLRKGTILLFSEYEFNVSRRKVRLILESVCPVNIEANTTNMIQLRISNSEWGIGNQEGTIEINHLSEEDYYVKIRQMIYFPWSVIQC